MQIETVKLAVKVSLDIDEEHAGYFIKDLEGLLAEYAEPAHKYQLTIQTALRDEDSQSEDI